jgi:hypothetical protein
MHPQHHLPLKDVLRRGSSLLLFFAIHVDSKEMRLGLAVEGAGNEVYPSSLRYVLLPAILWLELLFRLSTWTSLLSSGQQFAPQRPHSLDRQQQKGLHREGADRGWLRQGATIAQAFQTQ